MTNGELARQGIPVKTGRPPVDRTGLTVKQKGLMSPA
jgi:hypothetical protein